MIEREREIHLDRSHELVCEPGTCLLSRAIGQCYYTKDDI